MAHRRFCLIAWMAGTAAAASGFAGAGRAAVGDLPMSLTYLPLEYGQAALCQVPGGTNLLLDSGGPGDGPTVTQFLKKRGVKRLDALVVTTWAESHVGGGASVIRSLPVSQVLYNPMYNSTRIGDNLFRLAKKREDSGKLRTAMPSPGERLTFFYTPPCSMEMVAPTGPMLDQFRGAPDCSLVTEMSYEKISFLSLGETTRKYQQAMWNQVPAKPRGQVLTIGRGGAENALLASMLKPLQTRIAILPIPKRSKKQPAPATLAALKRAGVRVYRTDRDGMITVTTNGQSLSVKTGGR